MASAVEQQMLARAREEETRVADRTSAAFRALVAKWRPASVKQRAEFLNWLVREDLGNQVHACVAAGADPSAERDLGQAHGGRQSLLMIAVTAQAYKALQALVDCGAKLNPLDGKFMTPILHASSWGDLRALQILLAAGASTAIGDNLGNTPLHVVCMLDERDGMLDCIKALLPKSDLSLRNRVGRAPLHIASCSDACLPLLLPFVKDVDIPTTAGLDHTGVVSASGITPLHLACSFGRLANVKLLLQAGASRTACDSMYGTALQRAATGGHLLVLRKLLGPKEKPDMSVAEMGVENQSGASPLACAVMQGHHDIVSVLLEYGAVCTMEVLKLAKQHQRGNERMIAALSLGIAGAEQGCNRCGKTATPDKKLQYCGGCQAVRFCSAACLAEAWPDHKAECRRLQKQTAVQRAPVPIH